MASPLLLLLILGQANPGTPDPSAPSSTEVVTAPTDNQPQASSTVTVEPNSPPSHFRFRGAAEFVVEALPSGVPEGQYDLFGLVTPVLAFEAGTSVSLELGAELRLRAFDNPPEQHASDVQGLLRGSDWDRLNDLGQVLRLLRIGSSNGPFLLEAGAFRPFTLGHGHLISRYDGQLNPDYHPAGGHTSFAIGPTRTDLFVSDVVGGRLFAGEISLDLAQAFSDQEALYERYHGALSVAYDAGRAGYPSPPIGLLHLDADAALYHGELGELFGIAGAGGRMVNEAVNLGAVFGFSGEVIPTPGELKVSGKLEIRKNGAGFRQGMFGPTYELSRFAGMGFGLPPVANEVLPDGFSGYLELAVGLGSSDPAAAKPRHVVVSAAAEYFLWGRLDADARVTARLPDNQGTIAARFSMVGFLQNPRYDGTIEARYRILPSLYAMGQGGVVFFPQASGALFRGVFAGLGVGFDFER